MQLNKADCNLRQIDFAAVQNEIVETTIWKLKQLFSPRKREGHVVYTPKECEIGKYAVENGTPKAVSR